MIFNSHLGIEFKLTNVEEDYTSFEFPKLNYSMRELDGFNLRPHNLLFNRSYIPCHPEHKLTYNKHALFPCNQCDMSFDVFAAVFFMLSRYEEYENVSRDRFGRFRAKSSLAFKCGFLEIPVVDIWIRELGEALQNRYPQLEFKKREYNYLSTIDVDHAYAYKNRSLWRVIGGVASDVLKGRFENLKRRMGVLVGGKKDPYDTFSELTSLHKKYGVEVIYFFLLAKYGENDKNISPRNKDFRELLRGLGEFHKTGIHPGFNSNDEPALIDGEMKSFEDIFASRPIRSRQHYLIFQLPETFQRLINKGIQEEYSMGYADHVGFRAGTSLPFRFYDLSKEEATGLTCVPFVAMDVTLSRYMGLKKSEAIERLRKLRDEVAVVEGQFCTLWHNETLSEIWEWKGWSDLYEEVLRIGMRE